MHRKGNIIICETIDERKEAGNWILQHGYAKSVVSFSSLDIVVVDITTAELITSLIQNQHKEKHP